MIMKNFRAVLSAVLSFMKKHFWKILAVLHFFALLALIERNDENIMVFVFLTVFFVMAVGVLSTMGFLMYMQERHEKAEKQWQLQYQQIIDFLSKEKEKEKEKKNEH